MDNHRFHIRIALRGRRIPRKLGVRRGVDTRLGVVNVGVLHERQVARTAGNRHVHVIFDAAPWHNFAPAYSRDAYPY